MSFYSSLCKIICTCSQNSAKCLPNSYRKWGMNLFFIQELKSLRDDKTYINPLVKVQHSCEVWYWQGYVLIHPYSVMTLRLWIYFLSLEQVRLAQTMISSKKEQSPLSSIEPTFKMCHCCATHQLVKLSLNYNATSMQRIF